MIRDLEQEKKNAEIIKKMIRHPRFEYAVYNAITGTIRFKRKPFHKWFKKEREVHIVVNDFELETPKQYRREMGYGNRRTSKGDFR